MKGRVLPGGEVSAMIMMFAARLVRLLTLAAPLVLTLQIEADAQGQPAPAPRALTYEQQQGKINAWTVGLAAGLIEGAPLRLAAEMARVVDDGDNLHVLPIVTRGPTENVNSLLYLRGIDLAIINSDALEEYRVQFPEIRQPRHLPAQSLPIGAACLRPARDPEPAGPRRQEGELQYAGHCRRLLRAADLQPAGHQHREDLHSAPGGAAADAQG